MYYYIYALNYIANYHKYSITSTSSVDRTKSRQGFLKDLKSASSICHSEMGTGHGNEHFDTIVDVVEKKKMLHQTEFALY